MGRQPIKKHPLELASRRRIFDCIHDHPGLYLREIARRCEQFAGQTLYHLNRLEQDGIVICRRDGQYRRYYDASDGTLGWREKEAMSKLRHANCQRIIKFLLRVGSATHGEIAKEIDISPSALSYHLNLLVEAETIRALGLNREKRYEVADPSLVRSLLIKYAATLATG